MREVSWIVKCKPIGEGLENTRIRLIRYKKIYLLVIKKNSYQSFNLHEIRKEKKKEKQRKALLGRCWWMESVFRNPPPQREAVWALLETLVG